MSVRREVPDGPVEPTLLQKMSPEKVFRDWNEEGVHTHGGGKAAKEKKDRGKQIQEDVCGCRRAWNQLSEVRLLPHYISYMLSPHYISHMLSPHYISHMLSPHYISYRGCNYVCFYDLSSSQFVL